MKTHGLARSETYASWTGMKHRCNNPNNPAFSRYGGRGIKVCERWNDFTNFLADMGERPLGKTLERKDSNGNYCPENCKWATVKEQNNNKRNNRILELNGEQKTLTEWAEYLGISDTCLRMRLRRGRSVRWALTYEWPGRVRGKEYMRYYMSEAQRRYRTKRDAIAYFTLGDGVSSRMAKDLMRKFSTQTQTNQNYDTRRG